MECRANVVDGYEELWLTFTAALERAQSGKGLERHSAPSEPFTSQIGLEITKRVGQGFPLGQAIKKIVESRRLTPDRARHELLDAIVYVGMAVLDLDANRDGFDPAP